MEAQGWLAAVAIVSIAMGAAAFAWGLQRTLDARTRASATRTSTLSLGPVARLVRKGVPALEPLGAKVRAFAPFDALCIRTSHALQAKGVEAPVHAVASLVCALVAAALGISAVQQSIAPAGIAIAAMVGLSAWAASFEERTRERMRDDLPDALRAMGACFHAGFTLSQTFEQLQRETTGPLQSVFRRAAQQMNTGRTAHEVLASMRADAGIPELSFVAVALEVQHESGGSMQHVLDATGDMLKSELELKRSLKVHTAQARLSARVVVAVTIGLVAVLAGLTEDFLGSFFSSAAGCALLAGAIGMQVAGIMLVRRMLDVQGA